jgi:signal transduction histidine kinase/DNA-binding response OmpR family regulator
MQVSLLHKGNLWLEKKLSYPGCTDKQLQGNKTSFKSHIFLAAGSIVLFAIPLLIFAPQAKIYIHYMTAFSGLYTLSLLLQLFFPKQHIAVHAFIGTVMHLMTFYAIIKLGGIATSGGLIYAGIANVLSTLQRQKIWLPVSMFSLFSALVILLVVLKPWLHVPAQMTPGLNAVLWTAMSIILIGAELGFVLWFIRQQHKLEERESRHLKEMSEFKDRFFTNITHEFRTPLTIINGMTDLISARPEEWMGEGLQKIKANAGILLRLVNQMLNLAKTESGVLKVTLVRRDVNKYLAYLIEQFHSEAHRREIDLRFLSTGVVLELDFDAEKLMHITTNLVSNALKYTPAGGRIEIATEVVDGGKTYSIRIRDTGIGIEKEHLEHLFDRFFKIDHQLSPGGTGIGLALTRELVHLLQGTINVKSIRNEGSEFEVLLPVTRNARLDDIPESPDLIRFTDSREEKSGSGIEPVYHSHSTEDICCVKARNTANLPGLLIVEDSADVARYLQAVLMNEYRIEVAGNGDIGIKKALKIMPDIILSDVMMPVMDGIEMLEKIKNDIRTSHIPVVMLTAKADIGSRLIGLERGADAYIAKPVDEKELHIQLKNLVELRKRLYERYASLEKFPETSDVNIKKEDEFVMKVRKVLETNLNDDEFGISKLCTMLAVSHAQLYRKFNSLCNITISDYFKALRLNKARELLLTTNLNVSEVAYATGFKSLPYFSREFTRKFSQSPRNLKR